MLQRFSPGSCPWDLVVNSSGSFSPSASESNQYNHNFNPDSFSFQSGAARLNLTGGRDCKKASISDRILYCLLQWFLDCICRVRWSCRFSCLGRFHRRWRSHVRGRREYRWELLRSRDCEVHGGRDPYQRMKWLLSRGRLVKINNHHSIHWRFSENSITFFKKRESEILLLPIT